MEKYLRTQFFRESLIFHSSVIKNPFDITQEYKWKVPEETSYIFFYFALFLASPIFE